MKKKQKSYFLTLINRLKRIVLKSDELNALEKVFKSPHNRGEIMGAREFKKHQEKL